AASVLARIAGQLLDVTLLVIAATAIARVATGEHVAVAVLIGWLVGLALVKALLRYLEQYAGHWVAFSALQRLRELFFARLVPQAPAATQGRAGAELTERATRDIDRIEVFFAHTVPPACSAILVPTIALIWLGVAVDGTLAAVLAPFVAAVLVVPLAAGRTTWRAAREVGARRGALATHLGDDIQGIREVLGFGIQDVRLARLGEADQALTVARSRVGGIRAARTALISLLQASSLIALLAVAASTSATPVTDALTNVVVALAVAISLWGPTRGIDDFAAGLDAAFAATARIRRVIDAEPTVRDPAPGTAPAPDRADPAQDGTGIAFDAVTFHYPGAPRAALDGISARIAPGEWTYIVGVSGSGKSTFAALLLRGWDPDDGRIRLDGVDLRALPLDRLRARIGLVPQHPTLLTGTIADNLRLAAPGADDATLREAITTATLDDWIDRLPAGLDTPVTERGLTVSGGQLRRLALARALTARPAVLILDEALSELDATTNRLIRDRLAAARPGMTIIEITHRTDLVPDPAPVLVLDAGRLVGAGSAGQLRATTGPFTHLEARV
ncbi:MAG TPA: ABC transporter ATP-binding protein, partial [Pseudonocardiaceae bacterium]